MTSAADNANGYTSLYQKEDKIYPRDVRGRYALLRRIAMFVLLGLFYIGPFIQWEGRQAVLFDLPERKFYLFDLTLWPQDFPLLALLLIIAAVSLFLFTALAGRLWCGYACPQTVWTEAFTWIERLFEGDRRQRMKLDRAPWTFSKLWRKTGKQVVWIALALFTGFCFVAYFTPARQLATEIATGSIGGWATFWVLFYGLATYGNAGYLREQVCKYMCPYARFQSSMFDKDTLIIAYDTARGEPRGGRSRKQDAAQSGLGDCIDCTLCVQVCPTGIDIREGLQYECIACAACVDACNAVMDRMGYPRGLVRYDTENASEGRPTRVMRLRLGVYALVLGALVSAFLITLVRTPPVVLDVLRDRNTLFRDVGLRGIENSFTLHVINKVREPHRFELSVSGIPGIELTTPAQRDIPGEQLIDWPVAVTVPHEHAAGGHTITFTLTRLDGAPYTLHEESRFRGPTEH